MNKLLSVNRSSAALMAAMMMLDPPAREATRAFKDLAAVNYPAMAIMQPPSKGKRSKRRRAAKLRATGHTHYDGAGWAKPEQIQRMRDVANAAIQNHRDSEVNH